MNVSRRNVLVSSAAIAAAFILGVRADRAAAAGVTKLRIPMNTDISSLDPAWFIGGGAESMTLFATMPVLARPVQGADGTWSWEPSEYVDHLEQRDDLHIDFRLKPGFMWSDDGGEITAEDVKFSFERYIGSDWATRWPTLDRVDITDRYSGTIVLKEPFVALWTMTLAFDSGFILPKKKIEALPEARYTTSLPAQCGPYRLTRWEPQRRLVLTRNPDWTATTPAFEEIEIVMVADIKAGELALQAGELDIADLQPETAANFDKSPLPDVSLVTVPGAYYQWIGMNVEHPKLADIRVRKAIQRGIDMASVVEGAYAGTAIVAGGIVPPGILGHRKEAGYAYAPDEARALLAEAGVSGLSLDLRYDVTNNADAIIAQIVQANLADIGIMVDLKPTDSGVYWNLGLESKGSDWKGLQLTIMAYRTGPDPADALQWFHSDQVGIWNWERWKSEEWDKLWAQALGEKDPAERGSMYLRMQELMEESGAYVWVTYWPRLYGVSKRIHPAFYPGGDYRLEHFAPA